MSAYLNEDEKKDVSHLANPGGNPDVDALSLGHDLITPTYSAYADLTFWESVRKFKRLFFIGCVSSIAGTYIGYTLTLPGNIVANQGFINQMGTIHDPVTGDLAIYATAISIWGAMPQVSQLVLQFISPFSADRFGLKFNMWCFTILMILAIIVEILAKSWQVYTLSKVFTGAACGFIGTAIMSYISEISMAQMRGTHLSAFSLFWAFGQLGSAVALQVLSTTAPLEYRRAFYSEFAIVGLWLPVLLFLPESPVYLCKRGNAVKAKKSMLRLIGTVDGYDVDHEYRAIEYQVAESKALMEKSSQLGWVACFKGTNLRRTLISTIPFTFQNFSGGSLVWGYTSYFFQIAGLKNPFTGSMIISCVGILGILVSFVLIDRVGRRPLLIYGGAALVVCDFIIGGLGSTSDKLSSGAGIGLISICAVWVFAYSISLGPIGYVSLVELSTPLLRAKTAGIAAAIQSCSGILLNYTVPLMLSDQGANWGVKIGYFFGGTATVFLILTWFSMPETKGRTYGDLDELFERRLPAWRFAQATTSSQERLAEKHTASL